MMILLRETNKIMGKIKIKKKTQVYVGWFDAFLWK